MKPEDFKAIRASLHRNGKCLSAEAFAKLVRVKSGRTVRRWEAGERDIPGPVSVVAEGLRDSQAMRRYFGVELKSNPARNSE